MLTIKQAALRMGKSELTIRRLIKQTLADNPKTPTKTITQRKGAYRVDEAWLLSVYPDPFASPHTSPNEPTASPGVSSDILSAKDQTITLLMRELDMLTGQLTAKDEQISAMNERARESNVLMARLQERLAIDGPRPSGVTEGEVSEHQTDAPAEPTKKKRRGLFRRR